MTTHALDLARWLPTDPPTPGEAVVVTGSPEPYDSVFVPVATTAAAIPPPTALGQAVQSQAVSGGFAWFAVPLVLVPPATAPGQTLVAGAAPNFNWALSNSPPLPLATAPNQFLISGSGPTFTWTPQPFDNQTIDCGTY
jgi:hypothetical protein